MPVYLQIALQIKTRILKGELPDGCAVPSERMLAKELGVHRNTVIRAYNELKSEGLLTARQGLGYRVSCRNESAAGGKAQKIRSVNWAHVIKDEYLDMEKTFDDLFTRSLNSDTFSFAAGLAASDIYDKQSVIQGVEEALSNAGKDASFYTAYQGDFKLRRLIAAFLREKGIMANPAEIQIFSETNQAVDFIFSLLLSAGDSVITEAPLSPDLYRAIELAGARQISVPLDENGMICEQLEALVEMHSPKLIYVSSSYQDPTGAILSPERRKKLLDISYKYRIPIIEEDAASLIYFDEESLPAIKALDKGGNVIYVYSFSLTLIPGINIAFTVAPKPVIKSLSHLVSVRLVNLEWIPQVLLEKYLRENIYRDGLKKIRASYREKMELMYRKINGAGIDDFYCRRASGGVYLWCHIPDAVDLKAFASEAMKQKVSFMPGGIFYPDGKQPENYIRLNFSAPTAEQIDAGMDLLINILKQSINTQNNV